MDDDGLSRSKTISPPDWWRTDVYALHRKLWRSQDHLAELVTAYAAARDLTELERVLGPLPKIDQSAISRCLQGKVGQVLVMTLISEVLRLPPPVYVTRDRIEAERMHSVASSYRPPPPPAPGGGVSPDEWRAADREVTDIEAGVANPPKRAQTAVVRRIRGKASKRRD